MKLHCFWGYFFLVLFYFSNLLAGDLQRCGFVFDSQKAKYVKGINTKSFQENLEFFKALSYNELALTRPTEKSKEAVLAYMEAVMQSVRGNKQTTTSKVLEKSDIKDLVNLLDSAFQKNKIQMDQLEEVLSRILINIRNRKLSTALSRRILNLDRDGSLSKDLFYLKLWTDPLWKVFEDFGIELKSYGPLRRGLGSGLRVSFSAGLNALSLGEFSLFSDGFSFSPRLRSDLVKPEEYFHLSLREIQERFTSEYKNTLNANRGTHILTKLIHRSFVILLSLNIAYTHLPVEAVYTSKAELQKQYVGLEIKSREMEGRKLYSSEAKDLKFRLETMSKSELVENIRRIKLEIEQKSESSESSSQ
jgi:hypothetical protein